MADEAFDKRERDGHRLEASLLSFFSTQELTPQGSSVCVIKELAELSGLSLPSVHHQSPLWGGSGDRRLAIHRPSPAVKLWDLESLKLYITLSFGILVKSWQVHPAIV